MLKPWDITLKMKSNENIALARLPDAPLKNMPNNLNPKSLIISLHREMDAYTQQFTRYFQDNYVFKPLMFNINRMIQEGIFSESPIPQKVVKGKDGWFFLGESYSHPIAESKGILTYTEKELSLIKTNLLKRKQWFEKQNITFYIAVAPNKHSVYGSFLPIIKANRPTKFEQLKQILEDSKIKLIDLSTLYANYPHQRMFHKTDTHWNDLGAFLAYQTLLQTIKQDFDQIPILDLADFTIDNKSNDWMDFAKLLNRPIREDMVVLTKKTPFVGQSIPAHYTNIEENRFISQQNRLKVLVYGDSFSIALKQYLKEGFGETVIIWNHQSDYSFVKKEKPDLFIHEIVERNLDEFLHSPSFP